MWKRSFDQTIFLLLLVATAGLNVSQAEDLIRGPFLQQATHDSIRILWRTDQSTGSEIQYGTKKGNLTKSVVDPASIKNHEVVLSGLRPDTKYYYAVIGEGGTLLAGDDAKHFFVTSPVPGTPKATRIWVIGDSGTANANVAAVRDSYEKFTGSRRTDVWLMLGDNAYVNGTDSEYQKAVFNMFPEMLAKAPLWPTLGNHDGRSADSGNQSGPYYDIFSLPKRGEAGGIPSGTEAYYAFDFGNIHFISLDSFDSSRSKSGAMLTWLENDLAATDQDWIIAFWHHPPYSKGSHDSDTESNMVDMRKNALPILESYGVDLVLSGHSHSYERSFLLDGHYGSSGTLNNGMILDEGNGQKNGDGAYLKTQTGPLANVGAVYTVAGSAGKTSGGDLDHPAMTVSLNKLGSVVLDVANDRLDAKFIDNTGKILDYFTIEKESVKQPPPIKEHPSDGKRRKCRSKLRTQYYNYVRTLISAEQKCINGVNNGRIPGPCPDALTQNRIQSARASFENNSLFSSCAIDDLEEAGLPNACEGLSDIDSYQACILAFGNNAISTMLGVEYADHQPSEPIPDKNQRKCQQVIAKAAKSYTLGWLKGSMKCQTQLDSGKVQSCPDNRLVAKTTKLAAKLKKRIGKICSAEEISALNAADPFGGSCAGVTDSNELAACQRVEHEKILAP
ncbi:MAG: metallophosphoesterase family protein [Pseudomonadota bacterium]